MSPAVPTPDVFALTAQLVNIASESFNEASIVEWLEADLRSLSHLEVTRIGDNLVARTNLGRSQRLVLAGHTDTVPMNHNFPGSITNDVLSGVGSADMKGGVANMLASARTHRDVGIDLTYVFYAREEVATVHSGLGELFEIAPELLVGDLAILGEPTDGQIEAGCQGSVRARVTLVGARAHTARAWMGVNAIHRAGPLLEMLSRFEARRPVIDGCQFHEACLAVGIDGGISGNVVPDRVEITIAHRFAPDRTTEEAIALLSGLVEPFLDSAAGDSFEVVDLASAAAPAVRHPLVREMIERHGLTVSAKLGWTDVARFTERGIPAINFGPGDALVAHTHQEFVTRESVERSWRVLDEVIRTAE
jgi:succinyl-diaminopimelate desuccinylase